MQIVSLISLECMYTGPPAIRYVINMNIILLATQYTTVHLSKKDSSQILHKHYNLAYACILLL